MDVLITDEQAMVRDSARSFLAAECTPALVRQMELDPLGYDRALWGKSAELGWPGLALPEAYGGSDLPLVYLGLVLQEVGRVLAPIPLHSTISAALTLAEAGSASQREAILPGVVAGRTIMSWAFAEADTRQDPATIHMTADADGDHYVLNGTKIFVDNVAASQLLLVVARTAPASAGAAGLSLFLVDPKAAGITDTPLITTAKDRQSSVMFHDVRIPAFDLVGPLHGGWPIAERMLDRACILLCAQMVGAARRDVEMAVEYAKMREAFGQPIGSFQSIQHMCADMLIWVDGAELLTYEALWKMDQGLPYQVEISQAKSFCNEKCLAAVRSSQVIHGGIGFIMDLDLHLWYRRVAAWGMRLGTSHEHRARIAAALLDKAGDVTLGRPLPA